MKAQTFFKQLTLVSLGVSVALSFLHIFKIFREHFWISFLSVVFFMIFSVIFYWIGAKSAQSPNNNAFTVVIMAFVFGKMLFSILLIFIYLLYDTCMSYSYSIPKIVNFTVKRKSK